MLVNRRQDLPARAMTREEKRNWLRLIRSENVGPVTFYQLLRRFGSATKAVEALPSLAKRGGKKDFKLCTVDQAEQEIKAHADNGCRLIAAGEEEYPPYLTHVEDAPPMVSIKGHAHLLHKPMIGIVGTRNASVAGRKMAEKLARELGEAGYITVSGLARGIDAAVHRASLETGTVAVIAGGIDCVYPPDHQDLYNDIAEQGLLISEIEFGISPQARHFPRRNRIISGLSLGVVVTEAALQSGSLITARCALEQGREVFAVPGSPLDPRAQGPNSLIKQGAVLVENTADILDVLHKMSPPKLSAKSDLFEESMGMVEINEHALLEAEKTILELLSPTPVQTDELIRASNLSVPVVLTILLELELAGRLERFPGNKVSLRYTE